jgi:hypothetical protein
MGGKLPPVVYPATMHPTKSEPSTVQRSPLWQTTARRLRDADWWAVFGELAMIVVGILVAFQLNQIADNWHRAEDRHLYLERLAEESAANVQSIALIVDKMRRNNSELRELLLAAQAGRGASAPPDAACNVLALPAVRLQTGAMQEFSNAGALELLPDKELRRRIHTAAATDRFVDGQLDYFRSGLVQNGQDVGPFITYRLDPASDQITCRTDLKGLADNAKSVSALAAIYGDQAKFLKYRERQLNEHAAVRDRACALIGGCGPD